MAAHNYQRPRTALTATDRATLARWRALGASDAFIRQTLEERFVADTDRRIYALAYCDHALRAAFAGQKTALPEAVNRAGMMNRSGPPPETRIRRVNGRLTGWVAENGVAPDDGEEVLMADKALDNRHIPKSDVATFSSPLCPPRAPASSEPASACPVQAGGSSATPSRIHCTKCSRTFSRVEDDPCLARMTPFERRTWSGVHTARYHRVMESARIRDHPVGIAQAH